jgi:hypothetical protein
MQASRILCSDHFPLSASGTEALQFNAQAALGIPLQSGRGLLGRRDGRRVLVAVCVLRVFSGPRAVVSSALSRHWAPRCRPDNPDRRQNRQLRPEIAAIPT